MLTLVPWSEFVVGALVAVGGTGVLVAGAGALPLLCKASRYAP